jgi:hypothetical protein
LPPWIQSDTPWLVKTRDSFGSFQGSVGAPKQRNRPKWTTSLGGKYRPQESQPTGAAWSKAAQLIPPQCPWGNTEGKGGQL